MANLCDSFPYLTARLNKFNYSIIKYQNDKISFWYLKIYFY